MAELTKEAAFWNWMVDKHPGLRKDSLEVQIAREAYDAGAKAQREQEEELCRRIATELCNFDIACHINHNARTVVLRQGRQ